MYQVRGKLFALSPQSQWKERGTGTIKLNVRREDGSGARLGECPIHLSFPFSFTFLGFCASSIPCFGITDGGLILYSDA